MVTKLCEKINKIKDVTILDSKDEFGNTFIHKASSINDVEAVRLLTSLGVNINSVNIDGNTALHIASEKNAYGCIIFLSVAGACLFIKNKSGKLPYDMADDYGKTLLS